MPVVNKKLLVLSVNEARLDKRVRECSRVSLPESGIGYIFGRVVGQFAGLRVV